MQRDYTEDDEESTARRSNTSTASSYGQRNMSSVEARLAEISSQIPSRFYSVLDSARRKHANQSVVVPVRPSSAKPGRGSSPVMEPPVPTNISEVAASLVRRRPYEGDPESVQEEVGALSIQLRALEREKAVLKAECMRAEFDLQGMDICIDDLLDTQATMIGGSSSKVAEQARTEQAVLRDLRNDVKLLENVVAEKEEELRGMKQEVRPTRVSSLEIEVKHYYDESRRLQKLYEAQAKLAPDVAQTAEQRIADMRRFSSSFKKLQSENKVARQHNRKLAVEVQRWTREVNMAREELVRLNKLLEHQRMERNATETIQSAWRGYAERTAYVELMDRRRKIYRTTQIQAVFRAHLARAHAKDVREEKLSRLYNRASTCIQTFVRAKQARSFLFRMRNAVEQHERKRQAWASTLLQTIRRVHIAKADLRTHRSAAVIQNTYRTAVLRALRRALAYTAAEEERRATEARALQERMQMEMEEISAVVAQSCWRSAMAKNEHRGLIQAALVIQATGRKFLGRRLLTILRAQRDYWITAQSIAIQAVWRMALARQRRRERARARLDEMMESSATRIQKGFRGHMGRKEGKQRKQKKRVENNKATQISRMYRGHLGRKKAEHVKAVRKEEHRAKEEKAVQIQKLYRGHAERRRVREDRVKADEHQRWMENERREADRLREEEQRGKKEERAVQIQKVYRGHAERKKVQYKRRKAEEDRIQLENERRRLEDLRRKLEDEAAERDSSDERKQKLEKQRESEDAQRRVEDKRRQNESTRRMEELQDWSRERGQENAALRVQALYRGYDTRKKLSDETNLLNQARLDRRAEKARLEEERQKLAAAVQKEATYRSAATIMMVSPPYDDALQSSPPLEKDDMFGVEASSGEESSLQQLEDEMARHEAELAQQEAEWKAQELALTLQQHELEARDAEVERQQQMMALRAVRLHFVDQARAAILLQKVFRGFRQRKALRAKLAAQAAQQQAENNEAFDIELKRIAEEISRQEAEMARQEMEWNAHMLQVALKEQELEARDEDVQRQEQMIQLRDLHLGLINQVKAAVSIQCLFRRVRRRRRANAKKAAAA